MTVSFNTIELTAMLLWSLHCVLDDDVDVLVVDNGSTDGSAQLLAEVADAGLCRLLSNDENIHHGPALNQAMYAVLGRAAPPRHVWILDSDVVICRSDTLRDALAVASSFDLLEVSHRAGQVAEDFAFAAEGYLVHRGRASLAGVVASDDRSHPLYEWALEHHEPHFGGVPGAKERYESLHARFRAEIRDLKGAALIAACKSPAS